MAVWQPVGRACQRRVQGCFGHRYAPGRVHRTEDQGLLVGWGGEHGRGGHGLAGRARHVTLEAAPRGVGGGALGSCALRPQLAVPVTLLAAIERIWVPARCLAHSSSSPLRSSHRRVRPAVSHDIGTIGTLVKPNSRSRAPAEELLLQLSETADNEFPCPVQVEAVGGNGILAGPRAWQTTLLVAAQCSPPGGCRHRRGVPAGPEARFRRHHTSPMRFTDLYEDEIVDWCNRARGWAQTPASFRRMDPAVPKTAQLIDSSKPFRYAR
jgi:hypothetical protein